MLRKSFVIVLALAATLALQARPAFADQWLGLNLGYFATRGQDGRVAGDVIAANRTFLTFNPNDLRNATVGGEWLVDLNRFLEAGFGVGYYSGTAPSVYTNYVNTDGSEIRQQLRLRIVPITATVRFLPLGNDAPIQPYIGAGVGIYNWRYSETGDFVDFTDYSIFNGSFAASGTDVGPVVLGGARIPFGPLAIGGEVRYQKGTGSLPASGGFAGTKIDLGGYNYLATIQLRF
ncbi:MAG: hypothetical protein KGN76_00200 [Acidobacteriota bacterium]|nr:hypothetical protein [Acidobacteriota bacterium]